MRKLIKQFAKGSAGKNWNCVLARCLKSLAVAFVILFTMSKPLLDADYAAIEARIVCWLAGQEDALDEYRNGVDRYKSMASTIYNVPVDEVNKHPQRFVGKSAILGCGFQMSAAKFRMACLKVGKYDLPVGLEVTAVAAFRAKHKKIVQYWYDVERCAQRAISNKGNVVTLRNVAFLHEDVGGIPFLLIRLPSGRKLAYPRPRLVHSTKFEGKLAIKFFGKIGMTVHWGDVDTYGGKLVENITQAVAADIMCEGAYNAEQEGYEVMALIHDQALAYTHEGQSSDQFVKLLTKMPAWADGLPLEAEGGTVPFYKKD